MLCFGITDMEQLFIYVAQNGILETLKRKMGFTQRNGNLKSYSSGLQNCNWREWKRIVRVSVHSLWVNHAYKHRGGWWVWSLMIANTQELSNYRSVYCSTPRWKLQHTPKMYCCNQSFCQNAAVILQCSFIINQCSISFR